MLIDPHDIVEIEIHYKKIGRKYIACNDADFRKMDKEERRTYTTSVIQTRRMTWGLHNDLKSHAYVKEPGKTREIWDNALYRENKLKKIIVGWDVTRKNKHGDEELVPVTHDNIVNLAPEIGEVILKAYDEESFISDEEEKKIAGQVNSYIMSNGKSASNMSEAILESDLIEQYNWLPQDIARIPYRNLQMLNLIANVKHSSRASKREVDALKNNQNKKRR